MTERRRNEIAFLVMGHVLREKEFSKDTSKTYLIQAARSFNNWNTEWLAAIMGCTLKTERFDLSDSEIDKIGPSTYSWLLEAYSHREVTISNVFRREIGGMAKTLKISPIQLIEFFRLLFIDIINHELRQTDDEVTLEG